MHPPLHLPFLPSSSLPPLPSPRKLCRWMTLHDSTGLRRPLGIQHFIAKTIPYRDASMLPPSPLMRPSLCCADAHKRLALRRMPFLRPEQAPVLKLSLPDVETLRPTRPPTTSSSRGQQHPREASRSPVPSPAESICWGSSAGIALLSPAPQRRLGSEMVFLL